MLLEYPNFEERSAPEGSGAAKAWMGHIQPFASDADAQLLLKDFAANVIIDIQAGQLSRYEGSGAPSTPTGFEPFLVDMSVVFKVLVLEYPDGVHPSAFVLNPIISRRAFPTHPHLRDNVSLVVSRTLTPAVCVYDVSDGTYFPSEGVVPFLDYLAIYLGKHLVWMRTLFLWDTAKGKIIDRPLGPAEVPFAACYPTTSRYQRHGYWPGHAAVCAPALWYNTIAISAPCHCGSGKTYGKCHRYEDGQLKEELEVGLPDILGQACKVSRGLLTS